MKPKTIKMNFPPEMVVDYAKKMTAAAKKGENNGPAEIAMLTDICTMLEIAAGVMTPSQPDAGEPDKN